MESSQPGAATDRSATRPRPPVDPVDRDRSRRPGVPKERRPEPWPNSRPTPARMKAPPSAPMHGRPNKPMPPVYGTAVPLGGLSGIIRRMAYRLPDHTVNHWMLLLLGDRVQAWGVRARRGLWVIAPAMALALVARRALRST